MEESSGYRDLGSEGIPKNTVYKTVVPNNQVETTALNQVSLASRTSHFAAGNANVHSSSSPKRVSQPNNMQLNSNHFRKYNMHWISPKALGGTHPVGPKDAETKHNPTLVMEEEKDEDADN